MKRLRRFYNIKLYSIVVLSIILLGLIESAPEQPMLFSALTLAIFYCIRRLWRSMRMDEQKIKRSHLKSMSHPKPKAERKKEHAA